MHTSPPEECECQQTKFPVCGACKHRLTGEYDKDGWTTCEVCKQAYWFGVGNYND